MSEWVLEWHDGCAVRLLDVVSVKDSTLVIAIGNPDAFLLRLDVLHHHINSASRRFRLLSIVN